MEPVYQLKMKNRNKYCRIKISTCNTSDLRELNEPLNEIVLIIIAPTCNWNSVRYFLFDFH